jgi:hypothetical protein
MVKMVKRKILNIVREIGFVTYKATPMTPAANISSETKRLEGRGMR